MFKKKSQLFFFKYLFFTTHKMTTNGIHTHKQIRIFKKWWARLNREKFVNGKSSRYYARLDARFTIPALITTGFSSFLSLLSTSDLFSENQKQICSITVGMLVGVATVINSISASYGFANKKEQFAVAADLYDKLLTKIEFEILNPNEDFNDFCDAMEESILEIKQNCRHFPPPFVHKLYKAGADMEIDEALIQTPQSTPAVTPCATSESSLGSNEQSTNI